MQPNHSTTSRRTFLSNTGRIAAASALAGAIVPKVHAAEDNTIRLALVGCGGRGGGAAADALNVSGVPIKLVAMADVFNDRLETVHESLKAQYGEQVDVPTDRRFIGFDAYKKAMDCLRPGDVAIFATPPVFRWVHFGYAIEKGLNVFMEKPISVDGGTTRRMLALGEAALKKNLKVGVGLMCRHCDRRRELFDRLRSGEAGELLTLRGYRMHPPIHNLDLAPGHGSLSELLWQVQRFHNFLWASGGVFSDYYIHNIDECCWMKDGWPVRAEANGGRHYQGKINDQNFDNYSVEYTFADGAKLFFFGRVMSGCEMGFASLAHGTKGSVVISKSGHAPSRAAIYKGQSFEKVQVLWAAKQPEPNPYQLEGTT
jgi:predicted dehydrogenase